MFGRRMPLTWLMRAGLCACSTVAILLLYRPLRKPLTPEDATGNGVATHD